MKISNSVQSNAVIQNDNTTGSTKESGAQQEDTLEIARHSQKDACGNYKKRSLFHHKSKNNATGKGVSGKGCEVSKPSCALPAPVVQFHGTMRAHCNPCAGATHTFDVMEVEYPGPCHTIPMEYVVGGREHHVTAPDLHVTGCPTTQIQPVVRFQPDTIHVYPGNVVDNRPQMNATLLDCQQAECEAPAKAPAKGDCSSSSDCAAPAPAKAPAKGEVAQECAQAQQQAAPAAGSSSSAGAQGQAAQEQAAKGEAAKGEAQQAQPAVVNFSRKHWRPFN